MFLPLFVFNGGSPWKIDVPFGAQQPRSHHAQAICGSGALQALVALQHCQSHLGRREVCTRGWLALSSTSPPADSWAPQRHISAAPLLTFGWEDGERAHAS